MSGGWGSGLTFPRIQGADVCGSVVADGARRGCKSLAGKQSADRHMAA